MVKNWESSETLPNELARHTSMDTGKHETTGAETKDFIKQSMSFMFVYFALAPRQVLWGDAEQPRWMLPIEWICITAEEPRA